MRSKLIAITFLTLSVIFIIFWFQVYQSTKRFNKEINLIEKFKTFSNKFNNLLSLSKSKDFQTSYLFQLIQLAYKNSLKYSLFSCKKF